jgi:hypothetical protein
MLFGVHLFEQFAAACGYTELPADLGAQAAVDAVLDDVLEGDKHGRRRAFGIDPTKTSLVDVDSFPQEEPQERRFGSDSRCGE